MIPTSPGGGSERLPRGEDGLFSVPVECRRGVISGIFRTNGDGRHPLRNVWIDGGGTGVGWNGVRHDVLSRGTFEVAGIRFSIITSSGWQ